MRYSRDEINARVRYYLPDPGVTALEHLRHTVAAFNGEPDDQMMVLATSGVYSQGETGLTLGDLRNLLTQLS